MKTGRLLWSVALLLSATIGRAQFAPEPDFDSKYATELVKAGVQAPDFKMKTIDGKTFKLSQLKGKTVVLDFWASWCPDCRKDAPEVVRMYKEYAPQGIEFVGVSMDTDMEAWRKACEQFGITYTQVSELKKFKETDIAKAYGVKWIPSMVVVDKEGKVALSTVLTYKVDKYLKELRPTGFKPIRERVTIDGDHGKLQAVIQKPDLKPGQQCPMVVFCHGFGGTKEGPLFELITDSLQKHGIASIRFDFNGHGESEGKFEEMTVPNEINDAKKVIEYVRDLRYVSKIALVGHSQGGVVASMTAGEMGSDISAVVLMAPAAVLRDDAIRGSTFGKQYNPLDPPEYVELWGPQRLGRNYIKTAFSLPIYETAANYHGPALIIHSNGDRIVPYTYGLRFHQQWKGSEYVLQEYFDHGFSQNIYRTTDIVSDFLLRTLK
ncbi:MAG: alpha/beta fold hydrolase [Bacteroidales bacterium]|nr:alpha/beta fold hydrolase [Bacteroidales bacterium]